MRLRFLLLFLILGACRGASDPLTPLATTSGSIELPFQTSDPPVISSAVPHETSTSDPAESCLQQSGQIISTELDDPALSRPLPFRIYLPPCTGENPEQKLPAIYLMHGLARTDSHWFDLGAARAADRLIASGAGPFLMVMPWERTGLDFERAVVDVLIPHIETEYGADPHPEFRAVGGISRGGGWAFRLGMGNPGLVSAIGMHSPVILPPDTLRLPRWLEELDEQPRLWIDMGHRDTLRFDLAEFIELLETNSVLFEQKTYSGEHTAAYWTEHLPEYIEWYVRSWPPSR